MIPRSARIAMDQDSIVLRAGGPTLEEGRTFARYLDEAAEGFFRLLLGRRVEEIVAGAYTQPENNYSFQNVIFAERGGKAVGMASSFSSEQRLLFSDRPLREAVGFPALRTRIVGTVFAPLFRILESLPEGDHYVLAMAVDRESRGRGIGSLLMDTIEERARAGGSIRLSLDVAVKNEGARRLYERRGMIVESAWPRLRLLPKLFVRMAKPL